MYDPLLDPHPGQGQPYPNSYWAALSGTAPADDGQLKQDLSVDVAIIGAGYTGLSCAYHLASGHNVKALVL